MTSALVNQERVTPLPRLLEVDAYAHLLNDRKVPGVNGTLASIGIFYWIVVWSYSHVPRPTS